MNNCRNIVLGLVIVINCSRSSAQFIEKHNFIHRNAYYDIVVLKIDSTTTNNFHIYTNNEIVSEDAYLDSLSRWAKSPLFAISASIVDSACNPMGLYIFNGKKVKDINLNEGTGNFFLKPNGIISLDTVGNLNIQDATVFKANVPYKLAIQSGPMLIIEGLINSAFDKNSKNRNIRCGVGIFSENKEKYLVFIKSISAVTFYEFSQLFQEKYKCRNVLNLESGNCSMHLPTFKLSYSPNVQVCRYLVFKL